ncbi:MAG: hypothetical protein WBB35_12690, partial [Saprospiraceae bacterium]
MKTILSTIWLVGWGQLIGQTFQDMKLSDFYPKSIYNIQVTEVSAAKYPVIDFHSHDYAKNDAGVDAWIKTMDEC